MPVNSFDIDKWDELKRIEFLRNGGNVWEVDFTEALNKIKEREKYDNVWEEIKIKMKW